MADPWKTMPPSFPANGATVWVRRWWFSTPFQAVWSSAAQEFTVTGTWIIPWWFIARWRPL
jgi:hypothetical protein